MTSLEPMWRINAIRKAIVSGRPTVMSTDGTNTLFCTVCGEIHAPRRLKEKSLFADQLAFYDDHGSSGTKHKTHGG